jgi:tetratricopeptide (TPR) repeat protein
LKRRPAAPVLVSGTRELGLATPAGLLAAHHEVVPFLGRTAELEALHLWCEREGGVRALLLHAPGGMGKTRLTIELCKRMRERGWQAGFVVDGERLGELLESEQPVLAVIDPAERHAGLRHMLTAVAGRQCRKPLRLLLLARTAGEWWAELLRREGSVGELLGEEAPLALESLEPSRDAIFHEAAQAFARRRGEVAADVVAPDLADPRYARVLYVHMAALAAMEGRAVPVDALMKGTLDREEQRWGELLGEQAPSTRQVQRMRQVVAAVTLTGGVKSAAEALALLGLKSDEKMVALAHELYRGCSEPFYIATLEPSLLGEAMVRRVLHAEHPPPEPWNEHLKTTPTDASNRVAHYVWVKEDSLKKAGRAPAAGTYLDRVFEDASVHAHRTGFTVLARILEDDANAMGWSAWVLHGDVAGRATAALAAATIVDRSEGWDLGWMLSDMLEGGSVELAERLVAVLPHPGQTDSLFAVGAWVANTWPATGRAAPQLDSPTATRARGGRGSAEAHAERARLMSKLGAWQHVFDKHAAALVSLKEAERRFRSLAASQPEAFRPDLAASLHGLGDVQDDLDQEEAALASLEEAVALRRALAASRPEPFLPDLAASIGLLGLVQGQLEQREAALRSHQEEVGLRRQLATSRPGSPYRATSALPRFSAADPRRRRARPEAPLASLAMSLLTLGRAHEALGQDEAALASVLESVSLLRTTPESPGRGEALARSLSTLSGIQGRLGRPESLSSAQEALETIWPCFLDSLSDTGTEVAVAVALDELRKQLEARGEAPSPELLQRIETFEQKRATPGPEAEAEAEPDPDWAVLEDSYEGELPDACHAHLTGLLAEALGDPGRIDSTARTLRWSPTAGERGDQRELAVLVQVRYGRTYVRIHERLAMSLVYSSLVVLLGIFLVVADYLLGLVWHSWKAWSPLSGYRLPLVVGAVGLLWLIEKIGSRRRKVLERVFSLLGDAVKEGIARRTTRVRVAAHVHEQGEGEAEAEDEVADKAGADDEAVLEEAAAAEAEEAEGRARARTPR